MSLDLDIRFKYLGHSTFLITSPEGLEVLVDPWVMSNPACPQEHQKIGSLDAMLITHGHFDHLADAVEVYQQTKPEAVVAIFELAHWLQSKGFAEDVMRPMNKGGTQEVLGLDVTMVHALHSGGILDDGEIRYGGSECGYVITFENGKRVYFAGDTAVFSDMALIGELYTPDVALLPVGDHFTMGPLEASKACELLGVDKVIPMHYGTFPLLTGTPDALRTECQARGLEVEVFDIAPGESVE